MPYSFPKKIKLWSRDNRNTYTYKHTHIYTYVCVYIYIYIYAPKLDKYVWFTCKKYVSLIFFLNLSLSQ